MRNLGIAALGMILAASGTAWAGENAVATIAQTGSGGGVNDYTITMHNNGTEGIGTFWFSWIPTPFYDFMKSSPTVTNSPSGWVAPVENEGSGDGYSIFWYTFNSALDIPVGGNATFSFTSPDSLASITGPSFFYPSFNTGTTTIYSGFESGDSAQITVTAAPEPASIGLLGMVGAMLLKRNRRNK